MASTSAFGWETPDDTDLVKDGAAAIRTLGNSIDTSMADLKGGTSGQVLSKASNTDMDFTWVTSDDANAIQNAIVDAKGDLIAASAADTPARLAVGNNGETLVADSSTSTGLRYTAGTVQSNPILNSAFQVWQRGTSFTAATTYTADRWYKDTNTGRTVSRQVTGDTTNLPNIQYCLRYQRDSGNTLTTALNISQSLETINSIPFAGKTVTMSFYARAGANFSSASNVLSAFLVSGTGTDQNQRSGYTGQALPINNSATLTTTWQRFSATATVAATATELATVFEYAPVGTAGANDYFEVTGVQLDVGSVALPFRTYAGTIQGELAACQRYYFRSTAAGAYSNITTWGSTTGNTSTATCPLPLPVPMRVAPTALETSNICLSDNSTAFSTGTWSISSSENSATLPAIRYTHGTGALTSNRPYYVGANNNAAAYIGVSAEL